jgi:arylsulfatase
MARPHPHASIKGGGAGRGGRAEATWRQALAALALAVGCSGETADPAREAGGRLGDTAREALAERVILITCDTLRADRLGVYGYDRDTSPRLDAFAQQAVTFERAYASAPVTGPSLSSLLAGRLPDELGVSAGNRRHMGSAVVTLAERVREAGLPTAAVVSNWVLRRPDAADGDVGLPQGFDHYDDTMPEQEANRASFERLAPDTTAAAVDWIEQTLAAGDERFFLWVHYQDPHGPYTPPEEVAARFDREPRDDTPLGVNQDNKGRGGLPAYQVLGDERRADVYRDRYDAEIEVFDRSLGELLDHLDERGLSDGALVIFSADHGESLGEHDYWFCHGENTHDETVRVPLLVRFPQAANVPWAPGGRESSAVTSHLDVAPTVVDALGLPPLSRSRGHSLLRGPPPDGRVLVQVMDKPQGKRRWLGLTAGSWRLVREGEGTPQLFDVSTDPGEEHDLAAVHPERVEAMLDAWRRVARSMTSVSEAPEEHLDEAARQAMKALGYLGADADG